MARTSGPRAQYKNYGGSPLDVAFKVFEELKGSGVQPTLFIFKSLLTACLKHNQPARALPLSKEMWQLGIHHDAVSFGALAYACAQTDDIETARTLFDAIRSKQMNPLSVEEHHATQLLEGWVKGGHLNEAMSAFEWMKANGVAVQSPHSYTVLISGCADAVALHLGSELHREAERHGFLKKPDEQLAVVIIDLYGKTSYLHFFTFD